MKLEVKFGTQETKEQLPFPNPLLEDKEEATIDLAQVLAANQALLKNICLKMEAVENRLHTMESDYRELARTERLNIAQQQFLLEAPKEIKAWEPTGPRLNDEYFGQFSILDRLFHPEKMRRPGIK